MSVTRDLQGQRVLVTGGAGFIGSELTRQLDSAGAEVVVVDNLVNGKRENLEGLGSGVQLETVDIRDGGEMARLLDGIHTVYHLACLGVRHSLHAPQENHQVNASATLDLLARAREAKVERVVYVSTSEVYGTARTVPMPEEHPAFPHTVYGASKLAGECYTRAYWESYGMKTVVVRPFNAYGPRSHHEGDSGEVIPKFLLRCLAGEPLFIFGDGTQTRDFTFVSDTARGILLAGLKDEALGKTINLGWGREITINELARLIPEVTGRPNAQIEHLEPRPGDVLRLCSDTRRAQKYLGFETRVGLRQGLEKLQTWYHEQGTDPKALLAEERVRNWQPEKGE